MLKQAFLQMFLLVFSLTAYIVVPAQARYLDYVGAGHWDSGTMNVSSSSEYLYLGNPFYLDDYVVNGSGLDINGVYHDTDAVNMWMSNTFPDHMFYTHPAATNDYYWIEFDLGQIYALGNMWVWNYGSINEWGDFTDRGLKDVFIKTSADGINWVKFNGTGSRGTHQFAQTITSFDWVTMTGQPFAHNTEINFGSLKARYVLIYNAAGDPWVGGLNPEWGAYDGLWGLSEVRFNVQPIVKAVSPNPADNAEAVAENAELDWQGGDFAISHDVYFGTDFTAVSNGDPSVFKGSQSMPDVNYAPGTLGFGQTYYWRVDANDGNTISQGDVWSFSVINYVVVDDFESYNVGTLPATWQGAGASVSLETGRVHQSQQALKVVFNNTSSVSRVAPFADWTQKGVKALTLYIHGDLGNSSFAQQLYVKLEDSATSYTVSYNGDSNDLVQDVGDPWIAWNIDLNDFAGLSLTDIIKITIGVTGTSSDVLYVDDIRLYEPRCIPYAGDINGDCTVDINDLKIVAENWLLSGYYTSGYPGQLVNFPTNDSQWISGHTNGALDFNGVSNQDVLIPTLATKKFHNKTIATWFKYDTLPAFGTKDYLFFGRGQDKNCKAYDKDCEVYIYISHNGWLEAVVGYYGDRVYSNGSLGTGPWYHLALVLEDINDTTTSVKLYLNGVVQDVNQNNISRLPDLTSGVAIGGDGNTDLHQFDGRMDNFRIYDYALSATEVANLYAGTPPATAPKLLYKFDETSGNVASDSGGSGMVYNTIDVPESDSNGDGSVNFADFADISGIWLENILWP